MVKMENVHTFVVVKERDILENIDTDGRSVLKCYERSFKESDWIPVGKKRAGKRIK